MNRRANRMIIVLTAVATLLAAGCQTPQSYALAFELTGGPTSSRLPIEIVDPAARPVLSGEYALRSGNVAISLTSPDGTRLFDEAIVGPRTGSISGRFDPAPGLWTIEVTSDGAHGSYEVRLTY